MDRGELEGRDRADPLGHLRARFELPDGVVYLDGNSLGPLSRGVAERLDHVVRSEWREGLIRSWNEAAWVDLAERAGNRIGPLIGADPEEVVVTDSTSVDLFKILAAAAGRRPDRRVLLTEEDNFPTDRYVAEGLADLLGADRVEVRAVPRSEVTSALDESVAALFLTHVDYRTGERHDADALSAAAHEVGGLAVWDLSHSAGALPVDVHRWRPGGRLHVQVSRFGSRV
ncbi:MAG: aminotransferase class V-fold PLP-dependent enzyme [Nitriliruptorales bacterium]